MQRLLNNISNIITYLHVLGRLLIHHKGVITIAVRFLVFFFFFSVPLSQLRNMIQDVVRTLTFMYSSLDRWVLSEVFSFQSLIFHWCSLKKTNSRINFNVSREFLCMFLYTCIKPRILLFLPFGFSLRTSKTLFKQSLSLQKVLSLIRLNHSHNPSHCGCQQHSANAVLCVYKT